MSNVAMNCDQLILRMIFIATFTFTVAGCEGPQPSGCYALISYEVSEKKIPRQILEIYRKASGDAPIERSQLCIAGDRLVFYAFRFRTDSKLREMTISPRDGDVFAYDVFEDEGKSNP